VLKNALLATLIFRVILTNARKYFFLANRGREEGRKKGLLRGWCTQ
jgi:hypothetical protein